MSMLLYINNQLDSLSTLKLLDEDIKILFDTFNIQKRDQGEIDTDLIALIREKINMGQWTTPINIKLLYRFDILLNQAQLLNTTVKWK